MHWSYLVTKDCVYFFPFTLFLHSTLWFWLWSWAVNSPGKGLVLLHPSLYSSCLENLLWLSIEMKSDETKWRFLKIIMRTRALIGKVESLRGRKQSGYLIDIPERQMKQLHCLNQSAGQNLRVLCQESFLAAVPPTIWKEDSCVFFRWVCPFLSWGKTFCQSWKILPFRNVTFFFFLFSFLCGYVMNINF